MTEPIRWPFSSQPNKYGYENNPYFVDTPTRLHVPCGRWYGHTPVTPPPGCLTIPPSTAGPATDIPIDPFDLEPVFTLRTPAGYTPETEAADDRCIKLNKNFVVETSYGGTGSGNDQLNQPTSVAVDGTFVWICDPVNHRIVQRLKSDLSFVQQLTGVDYYSVHAGSSDYIWAGASGKIDELLKTDLSVNRTIIYPACGPTGIPRHPSDITSDDVNLYVVDGLCHRVTTYDLATLTFQGEFGTRERWITDSSGVFAFGGFLFIVDYRDYKIYKVNAATWAIVAEYGHVACDTGVGYIHPVAIAGDALKLYVADANGSVEVFDHNLVHLSTITSHLSSPISLCVDANFIYVADIGNNYIAKFFKATGVYLSHDTTVYTSLKSITVDGTYLYILDLATMTRIVQLDNSTLAYVADYQDTYYDMRYPTSLISDGTYIFLITEEFLYQFDNTMSIVTVIDMMSSMPRYQFAIDGNDAYLANAYGVSHYDITGTTLPGVIVGAAPADNALDPNFWMDNPVSITCDDLCIYIIETRWGDIKIYDKSTGAYVGKKNTGMFPTGICVDSTYLYLSSLLIYGVRKFQKAPPYSMGISNYILNCVAIDTAYDYQV